MHRIEVKEMIKDENRRKRGSDTQAIWFPLLVKQLLWFTTSGRKNSMVSGLIKGQQMTTAVFSSVSKVVSGIVKVTT